MKKVFCILLCAAMLCSGFLAAAAPAVEQKSVVGVNQAYALLREKAELTNFAAVRMGENADRQM